MALLAHVLELDAHHLPARSLLALLYEKNEKYREALHEYLVILAEEESIIDARANLGVLYCRLGLRDKALAEIDRAISITRARGHSDARFTLLKKEIAE
jgi:tetratricopeptide (TPR) repeat protein